MEHLDLKPTHAAVKNYYAALGQFDQLQIDHEGAVRSAFQFLLSNCARKFKWTLVPEYSIPRKGQSPIRVDGAVLDTFKLRMGAWEAKDSHDDLEKEVKHKLGLGYPRDNIIFQAPERAILYQSGIRQGLNEDISDAKNLVELLKTFFEWERPHHEEWEAAVKDFKAQLPTIAEAAKELIDNERRVNKKFVDKFDAFYALCRQAINPNLSEDAVEGMLIQHLLTERIFRKVFDNPDFSRRNVIAQEIEKVIDSLTSKAFNKDAFLAGLDHFYRAIELNAESAEGYSEKQQFLNSVYERFFQGYSPKEADTLGIVYTPQSIVEFMVRSVEEILKKEFGRSLSDKGVHILDPFVGTGNFIVRVMKEIKTSALPYKYEHELHCNEVMLMPYYIASMNIEHEYLDRTGEYRPFTGICLVDTFELAESEQRALAFMNEENAERVRKQKQAPIFVIIGNPPYNAWQVDQNDNNKNRKYPAVDERVSETYSQTSTATNRSALADPYVKAIRWASDRIGTGGIVALVTNSGFVEGLAADGMRQALAEDFSSIYVLDLGGNVRKNPRLSGTTHNVFGIQVGVSINLFLRNPLRQPGTTGVFYSAVQADWRKEQKYQYLEAACSYSNVPWTKTNDKRNWLKQMPEAVAASVPITHKGGGAGSSEEVFLVSSNGNDSGRDAWVYNFNSKEVERTANLFAEAYNGEVDRWLRSDRTVAVDAFVASDQTKIKWTRNAKRDLRRGKHIAFNEANIGTALYRPFTRMFLYTGRTYNKEVALIPSIFPSNSAENLAICFTGPASERPFMCMVTGSIPDLHLVSPGCGTVTCPFYLYENGNSTKRRENITDWALGQFRSHYGDKKITKWDIFHYVYSVLHHPTYRERYAANLKRELPRIPFVKAGPSGLKPTRDDTSAFWEFVKAGRRLAEIHVEYEKQPEYPLERVENPEEKLNWRVQKMRPSKEKTVLIYNDWLTLKGIPPECYEYRLGNRSALEWVVDQYQVSTDKRSGIRNDPNREDDPEYIVRLIGQVITVSLETVRIVKSLPEFVIDEAKAAGA
ncbi:MAG: N-6 DNA methylase [Acidobacteriia bacterium]|nr:N-6 DNA methylase [Terriglobia bacterium]